MRHSRPETPVAAPGVISSEGSPSPRLEPGPPVRPLEIPQPELPYPGRDLRHELAPFAPLVCRPSSLPEYDEGGVGF